MDSDLIMFSGFGFHILYVEVNSQNRYWRFLNLRLTQEVLVCDSKICEYWWGNWSEFVWGQLILKCTCSRYYFWESNKWRKQVCIFLIKFHCLSYSKGIHCCVQGIVCKDSSNISSLWPVLWSIWLLCIGSRGAKCLQLRPSEFKNCSEIFKGKFSTFCKNLWKCVFYGDVKIIWRTMGCSLGMIYQKLKSLWVKLHGRSNCLLHLSAMQPPV